MRPPTGVDRTTFRVADWEEHVATHDGRWREYWLNQPVAVRLAGAMRCRRRVDGPLPSLDRTHFRPIDLSDLDH